MKFQIRATQEEVWETTEPSMLELSENRFALSDAKDKNLKTLHREETTDLPLLRTP